MPECKRKANLGEDGKADNVSFSRGKFCNRIMSKRPLWAPGLMSLRSREKRSINRRSN